MQQLWKLSQSLPRSLSAAPRKTALAINCSSSFQGSVGRGSKIQAPSSPSTPQGERRDDLFQYVWFYKYGRMWDEHQSEAKRKELLQQWGQMGIKGRVYLHPEEGINGQISVPLSTYNNFLQEVQSSPDMNGVKIFEGDKIALAKVPKGKEQSVMGFNSLHVRTRQLISDGMEGELNMAQTGDEISPLDWHSQLERIISGADKDTVVIDCRNFYESEIGIFEGAKRIHVERYSESFRALDKMMKGNEDKKMMLYCTGGIRCERVGAYLVQKKGMKDVKRLQGGISNYLNYVHSNSDMKSLFKGRNFVFDQRLLTDFTSEPTNSQAGEDVISKCYHCSTPTNVYKNCQNSLCNKLFLECTSCTSVHYGCCSVECRDLMTLPEGILTRIARWYAQDTPPQTRSRSREMDLFTAVNTLITSPSIARYSQEHSSAEDEILQGVAQRTHDLMGKRSDNMVGPLQGALLRMLVQSTGAKRVLEIGTFTGYSTLWMLGGIDKANGVLVTCEKDPEVAAIAQQNILEHPDGGLVTLEVGNAIETLQKWAEKIKSGQELPFDFCFVDANKRDYRIFYDFIMSGGLLRVGGMMALDNVLWQGMVIKEGPLDKRTQAIKEFNDHLKMDDTVEKVLLPIRDGLFLVRRK